MCWRNKNKKHSPCPTRSQSNGGEWQIDERVQMVAAKIEIVSFMGADEHSYQKLEEIQKMLL